MELTLRPDQKRIEAVRPENCSGKQEMVARVLVTRGVATGTGLCVGASLHYLAGLERRAPVLVQKAGLAAGAEPEAALAAIPGGRPSDPAAAVAGGAVPALKGGGLALGRFTASAV